MSSGARPLDDIVRQQADVDALATLNGRSVQVLVWNYHDDPVSAAASPVTLQVKVPVSFGSSASLTHLRADETHGEAYTVWVAQGMRAGASEHGITARVRTRARRDTRRRLR